MVHTADTPSPGMRLVIKEWRGLDWLRSLLYANRRLKGTSTSTATTFLSLFCRLNGTQRVEYLLLKGKWLGYSCWNDACQSSPVRASRPLRARAPLFYLIFSFFFSFTTGWAELSWGVRSGGWKRRGHRLKGSARSTYKYWPSSLSLVPLLSRPTCSQAVEAVEEKGSKRVSAFYCYCCIPYRYRERQREAEREMPIKGLINTHGFLFGSLYLSKK